MHSSVTVIDHPLVQHKLTVLRDRDTSTAKFRDVLRELSTLLAYEVTRDLPLTTRSVDTPLAHMAEAPTLEGKKLCFVSILRAGNGLLEGMLELIPTARVGHVGLYRDHKTLQPVEYYYKMPAAIDERRIVVVDPMLATGHSAAAAVSRIKQDGARDIRFLCLVASPEGVATFQETHPDVPVYTAVVDEGLNEKAYIVPGLGDAGDRMYGTK
ncbi:Uracil phosphoribosyltransferase [wastewater metagenome]|uniref:uracil phosphoribosyltransferase n=2 Tax=unclassified sequences TaxID=12908 RepID=A0A5B8R6I4_9ZZZZ|nr:MULTISPECIES: uracil phosphoribosyltransferase [Arhodomonas]MCS4504063.1 uracil phosphoribosyltransferase [Arhodomonas aquaeolei]QEA04240.1 uracil phosphoribosyltransferase [uncultured organism]